MGSSNDIHLGIACSLASSSHDTDRICQHLAYAAAGYLFHVFNHLRFYEEMPLEAYDEERGTVHTQRSMGNGNNVPHVGCRVVGREELKNPEELDEPKIPSEWEGGGV